MTSMSAKIFEIFRNLKSDAVPRGPRVQHVEPDIPAEENNENLDDNEPQEILIEEPEEEELKKDKKPKSKKSFFTPNKEKSETPKKEKKKSDCSVNTQATGNVINVVNSTGVRWGDDYYMGTAKPPSKKEAENTEDNVKKCNLINLLMEAKIKPEHEYLDHVSNNLGKNWHSFFIKLGFLKGRIETMEINTREYGVTEARYKLLLEWVRNKDDGTLGNLATKLWDHGDRALVKELAIIYNKNKDK